MPCCEKDGSTSDVRAAEAGMQAESPPSEDAKGCGRRQSWKVRRVEKGAISYIILGVGVKVFEMVVGCGG